VKIYKIAQENFYTEEIAENTKDPEILRKILEKGNDDYVSRQAALNPNCPPEALKEVLKRGNNNDVSQYAAINPNCPPLAKIMWMRSTGKIEKEDPKKHIIEYDNKEEKVDEDLEKLKKLISLNLRKYKIAQEN
jgi:hypothetical protein